ncbi:VOC family protein [Natronocalculus amylovorans]|uniref:VOC family protein n=1 Tax=Natronocalculus amylovorans TaxID=2917812 RepID=A0AAE3FZL7_9EURY|nr:VOC family protein [Natronocalculus amylovorans]MCL9818130.1 VOC family protein [Natronocalculus amylovorans]
MDSRSIFSDLTSIGRAALTVQDLDRMVSFYCTIVGLSVLETSADTTTLGVGPEPLLVLIEDKSAQPRTPQQAGLFHIAFRYPTDVALGAALDRVQSEWNLDGAADHLVSEALYLTDPENNGLELYIDRPRGAWPYRANGTIKIGTVPLALDGLTQSSDGSQTAPTGTTIGHLHLAVSSIDRARGFYVDKLGMTPQTTMESALFVAFGGYHHHLGLNTWQNRAEPAGGCGLAWFEFVVDLNDGESLETVHEQCLTANLPVTTTGSYLELSDPDQIKIRVRTQKQSQ